MILFLDTSDLKKIRFALLSENKQSKPKSKTLTLPYSENHLTLQLLQQFLKTHKISLSHLTKIIVCSGPGSFTGLRVGVSLAQGLAFGLGIPLTTIKKTRLPKNLRDLVKTRPDKKPDIEYGRPAVY